MKNKKLDNGFTLIEILIVIVIVGILATIATQMVRGSRSLAHESSAVQTLRIINQAETSIKISQNSYADLNVLATNNLINSDVSEFLSSGTELMKSGYSFQLTFIDEHYLISSIPNGGLILGSGYRRFGTSDSLIIYNDLENIETHYQSIEELTQGTSTPIEEN